MAPTHMRLSPHTQRNTEGSGLIRKDAVLRCLLIRSLLSTTHCCALDTSHSAPDLCSLTWLQRSVSGFFNLSVCQITVIRIMLITTSPAHEMHVRCYLISGLRFSSWIILEHRQHKIIRQFYMKPLYHLLHYHDWAFLFWWPGSCRYRAAVLLANRSQRSHVASALLLPITLCLVRPIESRWKLFILFTLHYDIRLINNSMPWQLIWLLHHIFMV